MHPIINFKAESVTFYFNVKQRLTKIHDNSGVGKSFLCEMMIASINTSKDTGIYPVIDLDTGDSINTIVINGLDTHLKDVMEKVKCPDSLIIIDEADMLLLRKPELIKAILSNRSSYFIFMLRAMVDGLDFDYSEYAKLEATEKKIVINYFN